MTNPTAIGIDLGGTKMEAQLFDADWQVTDSRRVATPGDYDALVADLAGLIGWATALAGQPTAPVGIGAAGLVNPATGAVLAANLPANGRQLPQDLAAAIGRDFTYINDARAFALSEAVIGAGRGHHCVLALVLGTGVGGGITTGQTLAVGASATGGEFGHMAAPAHLIAQFGLPIFDCGCGQTGCIETYLSGPGLARMAQAMLGRELTTRQIEDQRHTDNGVAKVWQVWCALAASLLRDLSLVLDPDIIVLGGGLSRIAGVAENLHAGFAAVQFAGFPVPPVAIAQGGDASGARGAAYAAWQKVHTNG